MVDWLADALRDSSHLVTASRRLARALHAEYGQQQVAAGRTAWRTPTILAYPDWLTLMLGRAGPKELLPTRLNSYQGRLLWERALRQEVDNPLLNVALLARQANEAWTRLRQWQVPLAACEQSAAGRDQRRFVRAAHSYAAILERENWIDAAGLAELVTRMIGEARIGAPTRVRLAGFDRVVPEVAAMLAALQAAGCDAELVRVDASMARCSLHRYENPAAELRAAGHWARRHLQQDSRQRIGIVVSGLEQSAPRCARLLREGLVPGWQTAGDAHRSAVNVSYGRKLAEYPAIANALAALRWLHVDLPTLDIGRLLQTAALGRTERDGRSRLELALRRLPDRLWSPAMISATFANQEVGADGADWLQCIERLDGYRAELPRRASPGRWAEYFDRVLAAFGWPGTGTLDSIEFQLVNRWRELLNEFARLELVLPNLAPAEAHARLASLANDTIFQPEAEGAIVQLLGPLEAAGIRFDRLWIAGFSTANWPAPSRPLALVSLELQQNTGMPDAEPQDTLDYSTRVLRRLLQSASSCVLSYAETDDDSEQVVSSLVSEVDAEESAAPPDPGWYARQLVAANSTRPADADPVPALQPDEIVSGGARTIQDQFSEPFAAFAHGRLGLRRLQPVVPGLAASVRGSLLHDALRALYADHPTRGEIAAWPDAEIAARCERAVAEAFAAHERHADDVLARLLQLEKQRASGLLRDVIAVDTARPDFAIVAVENSVAATIGGLQLQLRYDRVDRDDNGGMIILDYKTGRPQPLLGGDGEPKDMQLVAYACALTGPVAAIGLINVDTRGVEPDLAGPDFTPGIAWPAALHAWQEQVEIAAREIVAGDVRLNPDLTVARARPLGLLSRYRELAHGR